MNKKLYLLLILILFAFIFAISCDSGENYEIIEKLEQIESEQPEAPPTEENQDAETSLSSNEIVLQLNWIPQAQFAGYYIALEKGFYEDEGLDVSIIPGGLNISVYNEVNIGKANIGVSWYSALLEHRAKGEKFVNIAQIFQKSMLVLVSKAEKNITKAKDLEGKKIGFWTGDFFEQLEALFIQQNIENVELVQQRFDLSQLANDEIDVASAMLYNEYLGLLEQGFAESDLNLIRFDEYDLNFPEDAIFVKEDFLAGNKEKLVSFLKASIRGWQYAFENPDETIVILVKYDAENPKLQKKMLETIKESILTETAKEKGIGYIDKEALKKVYDTLIEIGDLKQNAIEFEATFTDIIFKQM